MVLGRKRFVCIFFRLQVQPRHVGSLELVKGRVLIPWKSANATHRPFPHQNPLSSNDSHAVGCRQHVSLHGTFSPFQPTALSPDCLSSHWLFLYPELPASTPQESVLGLSSPFHVLALKIISPRPAGVAQWLSVPL